MLVDEDADEDKAGDQTQKSCFLQRTLRYREVADAFVTIKSARNGKDIDTDRLNNLVRAVEGRLKNIMEYQVGWDKKPQISC